MIGIIKIWTDKSFGFIDEGFNGSGRRWFFRFGDFVLGTRYELVRKGLKVSFENKNTQLNMENELNAGLLRDEDLNHRNPRRPSIFIRRPSDEHGIQRKAMPAASKVKILMEQESANGK